MEEFFQSERLSNAVTRIVDLAGVACYLIEGQERACLLDTCCGYGDLRAFVRSLTEKEPFVVLTHGHYDHTGGAGFFREVWMHPEDSDVLRKHSERRERFFNLDRDSIPSLSAVSFEGVHIFRGPTRPLSDGTVFNLGGTHLRMIHVPGHTPGMMCALLEEERTIFFGDACGVNVLLHDEFSSCASDYLNSLRYLKSYESAYDTVYRNHGSFTNGKDLLDNVMECAARIAAKTDDHWPVAMFGQTLYQAKRADQQGRIDGKQGNIIYAEEKRQ